jgi:glucosamine--fructose-6-phosphate aminotransferase (isomerizing)
MVKKLKETKKKSLANNMLKEIFEQPKVIKNIINEYIDKNGMVRFKELEDKVMEMKKIKRVILLGCGTSYYAALFGNYIIEEFTGLNCEVELADEFINRKVVIEKGTAVIALSQSGETTDTVKAARLAKRKGAILLSLSNDEESSLAKLSDIFLNIQASQESAVAATKTFIAQLVVLIMLPAFLISKSENFQKSKDIVQKINQLPKQVKAVLQLEKEIRKIAKRYIKTEDVVILGEKYNYPIALEGALKLKETSYVHAEGFAIREFKHGPMAIMDKEFICIFIASDDNDLDKDINILKQVKQAGSKIIAITPTGKKELNKIADDIILIPKTLDIFTPILSIIPLQLLAYHLAILKGINIDKPRNITKVVKD